jgi:hypothetical protein
MPGLSAVSAWDSRQARQAPPAEPLRWSQAAGRCVRGR